MKKVGKSAPLNLMMVLVPKPGVVLAMKPVS